MEFFIGDLKVIDTRNDDKGNTYHLTLSRSLVLSIICELGIKETSYKDKYYLNYVSVLKNSDLKKPIGSKDFSYEPFSMERIISTAKQLLTGYVFEQLKDLMSQKEIEALATKLIDEIFLTDQKQIDKLIELFG